MENYLTKTLAPEFVNLMPPNLEDGVLYISMTYGTAIHKCPCGCGEKIVTPLIPTGWKLIYDGRVTLWPSVANGSLECKSHYFIENNNIIGAKHWDDEDFDEAKKKDEKERKHYFKKNNSKK